MRNKMLSLESLKQKYELNTNLDSIIRDLELEEAKSGQLVCEIYVNGHYIPAEEEGQLKNFALSELTFLEITTRSQNELIQSNLKTLLQWIPRICQSIKLQLSRLDKNSINEEIQNILEIIEGTQWVVQSLSHLQPHLLGLVNSKEFDQNLKQVTENITLTLKQISNSIENQDKVLLKDILNYELRLHLDEGSILLLNQKEIQGLINL